MSHLILKQGKKMKMTKLSLVAALAVSAAFAGGDIAPVEPVVAAPVADCDKDTTIAGKLQAYYITDDSTDEMFGDHHQLGTAATLDVAHKLFDNVTLNFSAVGYLNALDAGDQNYGYFEGSKKGAFFNVANLTATYGDTTLIAGRQLIDSPMFGSFDWLLAPSAFEAYTLVNKSISDVTLVGTYVTKHRGVNAGDAWTNLTKINGGDNYALGAVYGADALSASVWYYGIDAGDYTQVYVDAGYDFGSFDIAAQFASTDAATDSTAYGAKVGTEFSGVKLMAAVNVISDAATAYIDRDGLYTSSWNRFASDAFDLNDDAISWKVGASTEFSGLNAELSYAGYADEGSELDLILGYDVTDAVNLAAIYTLTDYDNTADTSDAINALEVVAKILYSQCTLYYDSHFFLSTFYYH